MEDDSRGTEEGSAVGACSFQDHRRNARQGQGQLPLAVEHPACPGVDESPLLDEENRRPTGRRSRPQHGNGRRDLPHAVAVRLLQRQRGTGSRRSPDGLPSLDEPRSRRFAGHQDQPATVRRQRHDPGAVERLHNPI